MKTHNKKHLGQNWLVNKNSIEDFINFCQITKKDTVLELGIGKGALTLPIKNKAKQVIAIEIDTDLINDFKINNLKNVQIINKDFLQTDLKKLIKTKKITKIVSAIPYNITSPIIHKIVREASDPLLRVCLITQKEFAKKLIGNNSKRSYFTNFIERYANITEGKIIKNTNFYPVPKVDSKYFSFKFNNYPKEANEVFLWEKFLHHTFNTPRKKINKRFNKQLLNNAGIDENKRPGELSLKELLVLYNKQND